MHLIGETILVVDDSCDDRFFVGRALGRVASRLAVQFVDSGDEAVAYLNGRGVYADRLRFPYPAYVITDLNMPHGDGFSVLRDIQAGPPGRPRVMMLSSSDNPEHVRRAFEFGASSYCLKPQGADRLVSIISTFLFPRLQEAVDEVVRMRVA